MNRKAARSMESDVRRRCSPSRFNRRDPFVSAPPPPSGMGWSGSFPRAWQNGWFAVLDRDLATPIGLVRHLAIRNAFHTEISWTDKQWIKCQIAGDDAFAVEIFPAKNRVIDAANMYHLWVLPGRLPFGIHDDD